MTLQHEGEDNTVIAYRLPEDVPVISQSSSSGNLSSIAGIPGSAPCQPLFQSNGALVLENTTKSVNLVHASAGVLMRTLWATRLPVYLRIAAYPIHWWLSHLLLCRELASVIRTVYTSQEARAGVLFGLGVALGRRRQELTRMNRLERLAALALVFDSLKLLYDAFRFLTALALTLCGLWGTARIMVPALVARCF